MIGIALLTSQVGIAAECVVVYLNGRPTSAQPAPATKPAEPPETIRIDGAFCGRAFGRGSGAPIPLEKSELDVIDEQGVVVAKAYPDAHAEFTFAELPPGRYRVTLPGFTPTAEIVEMTSRSQGACLRPLFVVLQVSGECTPPSHISLVSPVGQK